MTQILTSQIDDLESHNRLTTTRQITGLESHFSTNAYSQIYTAKKIQFSHQDFELSNLIDLELAEYVAGKILVDKDQRKFYTNSVWTRVKTQFLELGSSVEVSNPVIKLKFSYLVNNCIQKIQYKYNLDNTVEIVKYLSEKSYLIFWLLQANQQIREVFPHEQLLLRVAFDPDITGWKRLIIVIQTNIHVDEAFDKLKIIDNNWWLEASSEIGRDLDIHIEFNEF
jgi:hypothetical protein